jgi:hypothetical protein
MNPEFEELDSKKNENIEFDKVSNEKFKNVSPEKVERIANEVGKATQMSLYERWQFINSDPECQETFKKIQQIQFRTGVNTLLAGLDVIPFVGEAGEATNLLAKANKASSFSKDATKFSMDATKSVAFGIEAKRAGKLLRESQKNKEHLAAILDTTPNISLKESLAIKAVTAPLEIATGGVLPSFMIEAIYQLYKDTTDPKLHEGIKRILLVLFTGRVKEYDETAKINLDKAAGEFA